MPVPERSRDEGGFVHVRVQLRGVFKLKRTVIISILGAAAALVPVAAAGQINPEAAPGPDQGTQSYKYEVYGGVAYTRIRQVPSTVSYSGLIGGKAYVARDWGKYFELMGSVDYYTVGIGHGYLPSPGHPTVYTVLLGPALHATIYDKLSGVVFAQLGGEHTGGESMTPYISFAGGFGGGLGYSLSHNFAIQLTVDRVGASFSLPNNTSVLAIRRIGPGMRVQRAALCTGSQNSAFRFGF